MRSIQVRRTESPENEKNYSDLQILKSEGGFYIGTLYTDSEMSGFLEPGSRDSTYFVHKEIADQALAKLEEFVAKYGEEKGINQWETWLTFEDVDLFNVGYRFHP